MSSNLAYDELLGGVDAVPVDGKQIHRVQSSFGRALWNMEFLERFYDIFRGSHPAIDTRPAKLGPEARKMLLHDSLISMLMFAEGQPSAATGLARLQESLAREQITIDHDFCHHWIDSLIAAVRQCDGRFDESLADDWRLVLQPAIDFISAI
jgi:hypothetical protein